MEDTQRLIALLRRELTLQTQHCKLLEAQQRALVACDRKRYMDLQADHAVLLAQFEETSLERTVLLAAEEGGARTVSDVLAQTDGRDRKVLQRLRDSIAGVAGRARDLCAANGRLIQNELDYMANLMELFVDVGRNPGGRYSSYATFSKRMLLDRRA